MRLLSYPPLDSKAISGFDLKWVDFVPSMRESRRFDAQERRKISEYS